MMQVIRETLTTPLSKDAYFDAYLMDQYEDLEPDRLRPAAVIAPGGGYAFVSPREGEPVAMALLAKGCQAFVLHYSVGPEHRFPTALLELAEAVRTIRQHAAEWHVNPEAIIGVGFSAGGHLVASLGTLIAQTVLADYQPDEIRLNGMMLGYPVITSGEFKEPGSFDQLIGPDASPALRLQVSLERQVSAQTPPTFLWTTMTDETVPVENSIRFAEALHEHDVACELHIFPAGRHGLSLATRETWSQRHDYGKEPVVAQWLSLFATWLQQFM